jgi:hypothetical protein
MGNGATGSSVIIVADVLEVLLGDHHDDRRKGITGVLGRGRDLRGASAVEAMPFRA